MSDVNDAPEMVPIEEFEKLKAINERVINERKADKAMYSKRLSEFEQKERDALESQNDYKSLYEKLQEKNSELSGELTSTRMTAFEKNLALEVSNLAKDAHSTDAVMRSLSIDKTNMDLQSGTLTDLTAQLDGLREHEPFLFKVPQASQTTTRPRYSPSENSDDVKSASDMTSQEIQDELRARAKAKNMK